jgi:hypothetical protein
MHISRSSVCNNWVESEAATAGPLDPDDMDTWPGFSSQSDSDLDDSSPLDESDWQMDIDDLPPTPPPMAPSPSLPPLPSPYPTTVNETSQGKVFTVNEYPHAAKIYGEKTKTIYETIRDEEKDPSNPAFPFSLSEWNLAYWAGTSGLSNKEIDRFLHTPWVCYLFYFVFLKRLYLIVVGPISQPSTFLQECS